MSSIAGRTVWHTGLSVQAREQALTALHHAYRQRVMLLSEKERVAADRAEAVRRHRKVASFDARLRAINAELLSIG